MDTIKNTGNYISESVQGAAAGGQKEAHKQVAKDSNASASTRMSATKDMMHDKFDEHKHNTKADVHKETAKH